MTTGATLSYSVVIPTYNRRDMVVEAVASVLAQRESAPHEVIVVVDGGSDDTAAIVRARYPSVRVVEQPNLGLPVARNTGLAAATGEWVCFLDDDDLWHPAKMAETGAYLAAHPDCRALLTGSWFFSAPGGPAGRIGLAKDFEAQSLAQCVAEADARGLGGGDQTRRLADAVRDTSAVLRRNQGLYVSTMCVRRDLLIRAGGSCPAYTIAEDWSMLLNVSRLADWHVLHRKLAFSRFHGIQMTADGDWPTLHSLGALVGAWYGGRPLPGHLRGGEFLGHLAALGPAYRGIVQGAVWGAVRRHDLAGARRVWHAGRLLLPRRRDRLFALVPPQVTWRWERYVLGMHK
jgi:glycosyltransferase involved in cell wall biosynthesis